MTAVTRHSVRLAETGWGDTLLTLPARDMAGPHRRRAGSAARVSPADLFAELPVALLERIDD